MGGLSDRKRSKNSENSYWECEVDMKDWEINKGFEREEGLPASLPVDAREAGLMVTLLPP
jgi:hypothetical protein